MKLNPDCIRDILIFIEENTDMKHTVILPNPDHETSFPGYSPHEIYYHVKQAELSGLIIVSKTVKVEGCIIKSLSPYGHQFLADIRSDTVWSKTKNIGKKIGISSLNALIQISTGVVTQIIKSELGLS